ncbi:MAG: CRISPR-associated endoribonuclease Cas6 [Erysipelotrichaceae bacterium]|nr:CRISPR-associated endoribonuclease Cas6 [Erysipelotrichaceae bacterium]
MRLKISFDAHHLTLKREYQHALQGVIYSLLNGEPIFDKLHHTGWEGGGRDYKMFVFSQIFGPFQIQDQTLTYNGLCVWYISSYSSLLLKTIYQNLIQSQSFYIGPHKIEIQSIALEDIDYFPEDREIIIQTLSPITAYRTEGKRFEYYSPDSKEFQDLCLQNLANKNAALEVPFEALQFEILEVLTSQKRVIHFKNSFFVAYNCRLRVKVNYSALYLIWNTGLSAKNSAGFGMVKVVDERRKCRKHLEC